MKIVGVVDRVGGRRDGLKMRLVLFVDYVVCLDDLKDIEMFELL
ncbi:hypothetical protein [Staphylococcus aureus]|nr:hypothetical protein [Staphylococcus aureus]